MSRLAELWHVLAGGGLEHVVGWVATVIGLLRALGVPGAAIVGPPLALYLLFSFTYVLFCAIIKLRDTWPRLHIVIKCLVAPWGILGYLFDVLVNAVVGSLLFFELPHEWLFTDRLKRWKLAKGYRRTVAIWLCERGLNPIDPEHC